MSGIAVYLHTKKKKLAVLRLTWTDAGFLVLRAGGSGRSPEYRFTCLFHLGSNPSKTLRLSHVPAAADPIFNVLTTLRFAALAVASEPRWASP